MRDKKQPETPATPRPYATEAVIRLMHDNAAVHRARAADREQAATAILTAANEKTTAIVTAAQTDAGHYVEQAEKTAAEMVRKAREQADADVQKALQQAAADMREAEAQAAVIRTERDAEVKQERYWAGLAAEEAAKAGLLAAGETLTDGSLDVSRADGQEARTDG